MGLHPSPLMTRRRSFALASTAILLGSTLLAGCTGCDADRHAEAQALDGGVVSYVPSYAGPATCFIQARRQTRLLDTQMFQLCQGAPTPGPVACFVAARRDLMFTDPQRIALCRCAISTEPVACVEMLERETWLTDAEMLQLCAPTLSGALLSNCRPVGGWY